MGWLTMNTFRSNQELKIKCMKPIIDVSNINIPLKTVIAVTMWIGSMVGLYYTMDFKIQTLEEKTSKFEKVIEKNNPELLELKITNLEKEVTTLNGKADKIYDLLNENN